MEQRVAVPRHSFGRITLLSKSAKPVESSQPLADLSDRVWLGRVDGCNEDETGQRRPMGRSSRWPSTSTMTGCSMEPASMLSSSDSGYHASDRHCSGTSDLTRHRLKGSNRSGSQIRLLAETTDAHVQSGSSARPKRAVATFPLDGLVIAISSCGDWSKRPLRTRRRMDGRALLR